MSQYLTKYKGKYRILAHYDLDTNDFVRFPDGTIDTDFDALYIKCRSGCRINHSSGSILQAYMGSLGIGHNVLKAIYIDYVNSKLPVKKKFDKISETEIEIVQYNLVYEGIEKNGIAFGIDDTSVEITFLFKAADIEKIAVYLKPSNYGASISPFSTKNLPKGKYRIPANDMADYRAVSYTHLTLPTNREV